MRPSLLPLALVLSLTVLCLSGVGTVIAACARSFTEGSLLTDAFGAGLVFLAPVYYPPEMMPRALRGASRILPTTFAADGIQTALSGSYAVQTQVVVLGLMAIFTIAFGFRLTRWRQN